MDMSRFDFEFDEIVGLIPKVTGISQVIELETRRHSADELAMVAGKAELQPLHPPRTEPTYRITLQLAGREGTIGKLADLATETGVEAVLDFGRSVRLRHMHDRATTPPESETYGS